MSNPQLSGLGPCSVNSAYLTRFHLSETKSQKLLSLTRLTGLGGESPSSLAQFGRIVPDCCAAVHVMQSLEKSDSSSSLCWMLFSGPETLRQSSSSRPGVTRVPPLYPDLGADQSARGKSSWLPLAKCKGVHRCQVLQLDGEEEEEEGREAAGRGRGGGKNWQGLMGKIGSASTQALTSSEETSLRRICDSTHSTRRHFRPAIF